VNVYCVECGASLRLLNGRWTASTRCTGSHHTADPLDVAARRVNQARDAVREAKAELAKCQEEYYYLKTVRWLSDEDHP
jgi:hypothetical protein